MILEPEKRALPNTFEGRFVVQRGQKHSQPKPSPKKDDEPGLVKAFTRKTIILEPNFDCVSTQVGGLKAREWPPVKENQKSSYHFYEIS